MLGLFLYSASSGVVVLGGDRFLLVGGGVEMCPQGGGSKNLELPSPPTFLSTRSDLLQLV